MPYSSESGKRLITSVLKRYESRISRGKPIAALDIGCGSGTYPKLVASNLKSSVNWTGVEIWEPYIKEFSLDKLYNTLMTMPALEAVKSLADGSMDDRWYITQHRFDLIFIGDVLEHMTRDVALDVIKRCSYLLSPRGMILISVPIGDYPQGEYMGNPHEAHVDTWKTLDELDLAIKAATKLPVITAQENEIGVAVCASPRVFETFKPTIAAYMICKDEGKFIKRCIESLEEVDEVVVCDTGSTDDTLEQLKLMQEDKDFKPNIEIKHVTVSPWRFDDARNAAMSFIPADIDLCVSIDADEMLAPNFVALVKQAWHDSFWKGCACTRIYHSFKTWWNWDKDGEAPSVSQHFHERVHARFGYRWIHPVHEKLVCEQEVPAWCVHALMIQHPDTTKNRSSYAVMLEQAVKENPSDWKLWSFLSGERLALGDQAGAFEALNFALQQPDADRVFLHWRKADLYERRNDYRKAEHELEQAIEANPRLRETYVMFAELRERHGRSASAEWFQALECKQPTQGYQRREDVWTPEFEARIKQKLEVK